ncbi:MAG: FHA domain-containing protein, partial [Anaerolineae bacterium]|nr:FHA domain-containing protein [Anaerolineae bacterium]
MIICPNCSAKNPDKELYCYSCGVLLRVGSEGQTHMLNDETGTVIPKRRWGTARFDMDTLLVLSPRDQDFQPMRVKLTNEMVIGRAHGDFVPDVDLTIFQAYERGVSRQHVVLRRQNDTVILIDLKSANSTFLNGQRLVPD